MQLKFKIHQLTCLFYAYIYAFAESIARTITLSISSANTSDNHRTFLAKTKEYKTEPNWSNSSNMEQILAHVIGIPVSSSSMAYPNKLLQEPASQYHILYSSNGPLKLKHNKEDRVNKLGGKADNLANGIRELVRLGPKISKIVKGKLSLGAKIIRVGGLEKIFKHNFSVTEGEKLLKASQCYLSTTAGPIAGLLFISTDKVAFCSDKSIKLSSQTGDFVRIRYKVLIPVEKILRAGESQNVKRPSQKYIEIVTVDNFDFWFMGFLNYEKTLKYLEQAISQAW
ncbi:GEM-like protein 4 [Camellia lanceoleosa]|uniref:GEM-like protein 4 n=1 Tax=Camellia lanceoleosa TaxID=1840588 RepID=A0ACC0G0A5_9ERIC|nr:GEM-like protein 4 [Camellia lanceoleosa]